MDLTAVAEVVTQAFKDGWNGTTPIDLQNQIFTPPDDSWVRLTVQELASVQQTLGARGARRFRRNCSAFVQVFTLKEGAIAGKKGGSKTNRTLAEKARRIFEGVSIGPAKFFAAKIGPLQPDKENKRFVFSLVEAPFYFTEIA